MNFLYINCNLIREMETFFFGCDEKYIFNNFWDAELANGGGLLFL